jgi:hypothetical protein
MLFSSTLINSKEHDTNCNISNQCIILLQVKVNVVDINDNKPHFIFPNAKFNGKYFGAIPVDSQIGTVVLQVKVSLFINNIKVFGY